MKLIQVRIFNHNDSYFIIIEKLNFKNNIKVIEQEFTKELNSQSDIQYYITNILNNKELRKHKIYINYISNDIILELINENKRTKNNYLNVLSKMYPNYENNYNLLTSEIKINFDNRKRICALVNNDIIRKINSIISLVGKEKVYYGIDIILLQSFVNDNLVMFNKKYIIILQKNYNFYRFYQILNGKIINYLVVNEMDEKFKEIFDQCLKLIDNKVDELIFDGPYNLYRNLIDKYFNVNVSYMDYQEKLKNLDERKLIYGKKQI